MRWMTIVILMLLTACATQRERQIREQVLASNLDPATRQAIVEKKIRTGMTKEQVIAAWGEPCGYCIGTRESSWGDSWEYNIFGSARPWAGKYIYFDRQGYVTGWSR